MYESSQDGFFQAIGVVGIVIYVAIIALMIAAMWNIFTKAGKPGWAAIIPIYNMVVLCEIVGKPGWWVILMLIPPISIIFAVWVTNLLSKSFGHGVGYTLGLLFLGFIFYPMLGFGDSTYRGPVAAVAK